MTDFKNLNFIYDDEDKILSIILSPDRKFKDFKNCYIKGNTLIFIDNADFKNIVVLNKEELEHIKIADYISIVEINNIKKFYFLKVKGKYLSEKSEKLKDNKYI